MSTGVAPYTPGGVEVWCDECGSVAWFQVDGGVAGYVDLDLPRKAAAAAQLHEDYDCAPIWLDDQGEPTTITTQTYAGGCSMLREWALEQDSIAAMASS